MNDRYMNNHNDRCSEEIKNDHYFQAVKDRRKRNYAQVKTSLVQTSNSSWNPLPRCLFCFIGRNR